MKRISLLTLLVWGLLMSAAAQKTVQLNILQTSDTHSRIEPLKPKSADVNAGKGGAVRRAALVEHYRKELPNVLLFDCGDISQGTPYYNMFRGELEVKMMNLMKYDAMTIGNHEFDFGLENMARLFRMADFPVVCANYDVENTVLKGLVKPYVVLRRGGLKVGVFGIGVQLEGLVSAANCQGVVYRDPVQTAQETADLLKDELGCDLVVCLSHLGLDSSESGRMDDKALIARTRHIDVVLGGHSHTFMEEPVYYRNADGREIPLLHSGSNGANVGRLKLTFEQQE